MLIFYGSIKICIFPLLFYCVLCDEFAGEVIMQKSFSNTRDKKKQQQSSSTRIVKPKVKTGRTSSAFNSVSLEPVIDIHKGKKLLNVFCF